MESVEPRAECPKVDGLENAAQFRRVYPSIVQAGLALKKNARPGEGTPQTRRNRNKRLKQIINTESAKVKETNIGKLDLHTQHCIAGLVKNLDWTVDRACDYLLTDTQGTRMENHSTHVEQWLAFEYLRAGGKISIYDGGEHDYPGGNFAKLLRKFRIQCGFPGEVNNPHLIKLRDKATDRLNSITAEIS